jgi:membrane associated rhomboid family serine protease
MLPTPAVPVVSVIAGTATISNYNSAYTYVFSPAGPSVGAGGLISGMIAGTSYTVTAKMEAVRRQQAHL